MPRRARVVAAGVPHHLTQRGNNRQDVFIADDDRRFYLERLRQDCRDCGVRLLGYCLMTTHVHLIAVPEREDSLARALRRTHSCYAQEFNRRYRRSGHLWQNRFFSSALGADHLVTALLYVDRNPVRAGLTGDAAQYRWSSARGHAGGGGVELIDWRMWREIRGVGKWAEALAQSSRREADAELRRATYAGAPYGDRSFVETLEQRLGRSLQLGRPGRKPKAAAAKQAAGA